MAETRGIKRILKNFLNYREQVSLFNERTLITKVKAIQDLIAQQWKEFQGYEKAAKGKFDDANVEAVDKIEELHEELCQRLFELERTYEFDNCDQGNNKLDELLLNQTNFLHEMSNVNKRESEVRLPRVNIPIFSGLYSEFPSFRDLFEASIHDNGSISNVHKLQYLKGLLRGEAFSLIKHLSTTEANYKEAWDKIKLRYDKRRHVMHTLIKQFTDQPNLHQSCPKMLRQLTDVSDEVIRGLRVLGPEAEARDPWLIHILINKVDNDTKEAWAHEIAETDFPTLDEFFKFLNKRSDALESLSSMLTTKSTHAKKITTLLAETQMVCALCNEGHYISRCEKYTSLTVPERRQIIAEKKLCFNCLSSTHQAVVCRSRFNCRICRRKHHVTLHMEASNKDMIGNIEETKNYNAIMQPASEKTRAILPTAGITIRDRFGKLHKCRALLDCGSQSSFVSEDCVQRLHLQRSRANVSITGITTSSMQSRGRSALVIGSLYDPEVRIDVDGLILQKLPQRIPGCEIEMRDLERMGEIQLADPEFGKPAPIDVLLGADRFFELLRGERKQLGPVILQNTVFGWVISGQQKLERNTESTTYTVLTTQLNLDIDKTLRQFWEIEDLPQTKLMSPEDEECEALYTNTVQRRDDGRYMVRLPFRKNSTKLGNSLLMASRRFQSLERKLASDDRMRVQYVEQIHEYIEMGHMVEIKQDYQQRSDEEIFYLPHHAVVKESSETTKVRIVFDGSAKTTTGVSLNEKLMVGPTIQPTLWVTLMRFRNNRVAITADIEKMYRQVIMCHDHTHYQRILWRDNPEQQIRQYRLTRVTFGLACSAYLAIRTLQNLGREVGNEVIMKHVLNDFYVDDFLSGAENVKEATEIKENVTTALQRGGFLLRKWQSNHISLNDKSCEKSTTKLYNEKESIVVVLGLHWCPSEDTFTFKVNIEQEGPITKRKLISEASRVFDPLGFLSPSIILMKILFQKTWFCKIDWDEILPEPYATEYKHIREEFKYFDEVKIPRFTNHYGNIQIHGFADASERAYSAVIYSRIINEKGEITIHLLTSKTKVSPVKKISLPRLELCAAHLLSKLMSTTKGTIPSTAEYFAWTDSSIVIAWLSTYPARWKTFVANRTSQILEKFPRQHWSHVRSEENPADHGSRGVTPKKLIQLRQWWNGPQWLKLPEELWPKMTDVNKALTKAAIEKEVSKVPIPEYVFSISIDKDWLEIIFDRKSNLTKIFRIVGYVRRFVTNLRGKNTTERNLCELKSAEIEAAKTICVLWVQNNKFREDIIYLRKHKMAKNDSKMLSLAPFIDTTSVLRVGGRLFNADCDYESKHPIILPVDHIFTERLIWEIHKKNFHAGPTLTNNLIRQNYWIINGRARIRSLLKRCVTCAKYAHKTSRQLMANLPSERVTLTRPFANCGIDFAGPLYFIAKKGRGAANIIKGYLCIFVCLSVKAIHIEPVSDLTSEAFLATLKRFTARRGVPKKIWTDNGTNFIGARRILKEAHQLILKINENYLISEFLSTNHIEWQFIPPSAPHFGGLWESAVKSVKTHLLKSTNHINLTFEEAATLLCQIENILNSRPLCTTTHGDDYEVLTPSHFLIGTSTGAIPELSMTDKADSSLSRWQRIQSRVQIFWKKYSVDYLNNLQQRHKWRKIEDDIKIDDVVIIQDDNRPVCSWPMGRIIKVHVGTDNRVRVATIKTATTTLQRPVVKLCVLPIG